MKLNKKKLTTWVSCFLLALVVFTACEMQQTDLTENPGKVISIDVNPAVVDSVYLSLDINQAAKMQYGSSAQAVLATQDKYGWRARVNGVDSSIDLNRYVTSWFGSGYSLVLVGNHAYDWRVVKNTNFANRVLPVVLVPTDYFSNINGVRKAVARANANAAYVQQWYYTQTGKYFKLLGAICVFVANGNTLTAAQWNSSQWRINADNDPARRYDLFNAAINAYTTGYHRPAVLPNSTNRQAIILNPYVGEIGTAASDWGAASGGDYTFIPPRWSSIDNASDSLYVLGHELGHNFGLAHSATPSIMMYNVANMILFDYEKTTVLNSVFFR